MVCIRDVVDEWRRSSVVGIRDLCMSAASVWRTDGQRSLKTIVENVVDRRHTGGRCLHRVVFDLRRAVDKVVRCNVRASGWWRKSSVGRRGVTADGNCSLPCTRAILNMNVHVLMSTCRSSWRWLLLNIFERQSDSRRLEVVSCWFSDISPFQFSYIGWFALQYKLTYGWL